MPFKTESGGSIRSETGFGLGFLKGDLMVAEESFDDFVPFFFQRFIQREGAQRAAGDTVDLVVLIADVQVESGNILLCKGNPHGLQGAGHVLTSQLEYDMEALRQLLPLDDLEGERTNLLPTHVFIRAVLLPLQQMTVQSDLERGGELGFRCQKVVENFSKEQLAGKILDVCDGKTGHGLDSLFL